MNDVIVVSIIDNIHFKIFCGEDQSYELAEFFTCYAADYRHNPKFKAGIWNGKISFFNRSDHLLPIGLLRFLKPFLEQYNYKIQLTFNEFELKNDISKEDLEGFYDVLFSMSDITLRDYQKDAVYAALRNKRGVVESATGSGKSILIYTVIRFILEDIDSKILLVVPNIGLVTQMYDDFKKYGWGTASTDISLLYGKSVFYDKTRPVLISTWQSIYKRGSDFFSDFGAVLVDETHGAKSASIQSVLSKCVNASYRLGFTGTLPEDTADIFNIYGYLGHKIYSLESKTLIERGFLSNITIVNLFLKHNQDEIDKIAGKTYADEVSVITKNPKRNNVLRYIIGNINEDHNVLVLCHKLDHLDSMVEYITETFPNRPLFVIHGGIPAEKREAIRTNMEEYDGAILIATYGTMSTGINIPKLHSVIFASFYKSKIKVLQSIGRGLRLHKTKSRVIVWDLIDDMHYVDEYGHRLPNYAIRHFYKRLAYYDKQEFPYINRHKTIDEL